LGLREADTLRALVVQDLDGVAKISQPTGYYPGLRLTTEEKGFKLILRWDMGS
jgi:hypothetical protein